MTTSARRSRRLRVSRDGVPTVAANRRCSGRYGVGLDGVGDFLHSFLATGREGAAFVVGAYVVLFAGVQVMFELRARDVIEGDTARQPSACPAAPPKHS